MKKLFIAFVILCSICSCSNYYKAILVPQPANAKKIIDLKANNKFFILRTGSEAFAMENISISDDQKNLQSTLTTVPIEHQLYLSKKENTRMKYKPSGNIYFDEKAVLNEVHVYISPDTSIINGQYTTSLDNIIKTEIIEIDAIKTKRSRKLNVFFGISSGVIITLGFLAIIAANSLNAW